MRKHIYLELYNETFIKKIKEELGNSINAVSIHNNKESLIEELQEQD